ncbi:MAG: superoxide dismutase family protein [Terriglobales bacterium]
MKRRNVGLTAAIMFAAMLVFAGENDRVPKKVVELKDGKGAVVGTATLSATAKGTKIKLDVKNLTPGEHAIHVHQYAKCEGPGFTTAGAHLNPENKKHGLQNPDGHHLGDMVNFKATKNGKSREVVYASFPYTKESALFANGGTSLMIHAKADDHKTDPSGNAGDRVACGLIAPIQ